MVRSSDKDCYICITILHFGSSRSFQNRLFYSFLGLPYAKAPIGSLRFKHPEAIEPWSGTYEADRHTTCLQVIFCLKTKIPLSYFHSSSFLPQNLF